MQPIAHSYRQPRLVDLIGSDHRVQLAGQPAFLTDACALDRLRRDLLERLGLHAARATLTRFGFEQGWQLATRLEDHSPPPDPTLWLATHPHLSRLSNLHRLEENRARLFAADGWKLLESAEAQQQLTHRGPSPVPVCWLICGLLSGYLSAALQRRIYVAEHTCVGRGDEVCCLQAGSADGWGPERMAELAAYFPPLAPAVEGNRADTAIDSGRSADSAALPTAKEVATHFVARSPVMIHLMDLADRMAAVDSSVIITGESGTGKERLAQYIHNHSSRRDNPFIAVNCGAVTESLLESELFGHVRGAFTGAIQDRVGLFEAANGGTLLLDEIGEIPPTMQVKLLRVLQNQEIRRVGESKSHPIDVRVIAATNRDLSTDIAASRFRKDLYFRLNVVTLQLPRLRDRREDLAPLANLLLAEIATRLKRTPLRLAPSAIRQLCEYAWPGNVRELENLIERAVALAPQHITELLEIPADLYPGIQSSMSGDPVKPLKQAEKDYILSVLHRNEGNQVRTAAQLKIGASTLYRKLKSYGLVRAREPEARPDPQAADRLRSLDRRQGGGRRQKERT